MSSSMKVSQCLSFYLFMIFSVSLTSAMPRVGRSFRRGIRPKESTESSPHEDTKILYYPQTLDHFNYQPESYMTFKQKYMIYSKHWGGAKANSPIFVYLGDEGPMPDDEVDSLCLPDYAARLKALVVIIEHRFYGESIPFEMTMEQVLKNASIRGYFNSAQAIADYAEVILHLKESLKAHHSPVIVVGGSYGGMLASWFRLKYPHIALGALASSAPVLYFDNIISPNDGYYSIVSKDFKEIGEIATRLSRNHGVKLTKLDQNQMVFCSLVKNSTLANELKNYLEIIYDSAAQYGFPDPSVICKAIDRGENGTTDILSRIYAAVRTSMSISDFGRERNCYDTDIINKGQTNTGYAWQTCSEMVMPIAFGTTNESMFPIESFNMSGFIQDCKNKYNVLPRPHWITTYYGGHDMKLILGRFGSNIIFSNGLKDPYSSAGVLENLSDSIIALHTPNGTHCMDILPANEDDPKWLIDQRNREVDIIDGMGGLKITIKIFNIIQAISSIIKSWCCLSISIILHLIFHRKVH